jgi:hypothetical protein
MKWKEKLTDFIDEFESEFGEVEGFEISVEHPIVDGERQEFANIKEFIIKRIVREQINLLNIK